MNRAEKRRLAKYGCVEGEKPTMNINQFIHLYSLTFILALDSCKVPKEKVQEIMEKVYETADCMLSGHINQSDVEQMIRETYNIDFEQGIQLNTGHQYIR